VEDHLTPETTFTSTDCRLAVAWQLPANEEDNAEAANNVQVDQED
jgi:hypothetical protein